MPEGDTILRLAARLEDRFGGSVVRRSVFRHPNLATVDLAGHTFLGAGSNGKHLFLRFDDGTSLRVHLLMQGRVHTGPTDVEGWRRRFELQFAHPPGGTMTGVDIPVLHRIRTVDEDRLVEHLGPDVCGVYDHEEAIANLRDAGDRPLTGALLDQRIAAGLGNIYAVEAPFVCGLDPRRLVSDIDDPGPVLSVAAALIRANARRGPQNTTGRDLRTDDHWVLGTRRRDCRLCGATIERVSGERSPWRRRFAWCPDCQPAGARAVDAARVRRLLALHPARRLLDLDRLELTADTDVAVKPS